jgi:predicted GIY-YIG superfamily endonuclease
VLLERVPASQQLLFPDPRPLVERLGREFFRQLPETPGVYLMRDAAEVVLYVGKAKNLCKRLTSYRVANPDRMPRRHLRMLRAVVRIELQACPDEAAALARESELLRALKPKFNRAGTWPATPRFLVWRVAGQDLELAVTETPEAGWQVFGPLGSAAPFLRTALVRVLWCAIYPELGSSRMPAGWASGQFAAPACLPCRDQTSDAALFLERVFAGQADTACEWVKTRLGTSPHPFDSALVAEALESLAQVIPAKAPPVARLPGPSGVGSDGAEFTPRFEREARAVVAGATRCADFPNWELCPQNL